jgi:arsenate reductase
MLTIYTYAGCSTCRKAVAWLRGRGLAFQERAIREAPPSPAELARMLAACDGELRRLCNTSGGDYRALKLGDRLGSLGPAGVLALLAANGNLIKRPFLLGPEVALVGFDAELWSRRLAA